MAPRRLYSLGWEAPILKWVSFIRDFAVPIP